MMELFKKFTAFISGEGNTAFQYGYLTGAAVSVLVLLLLFVLICLLRSKPKCKGVVLETAGGKLYITASAIADLVKSVEKDFPTLQIVKTVLVEKKHILTMELRVNFPPVADGGSLPVVAGALQQKILDDLKNTFGLEGIKEINIEVQRGKKA